MICAVIGEPVRIAAQHFRDEYRSLERCLNAYAVIAGDFRTPRLS